MTRKLLLILLCLLTLPSAAQRFTLRQALSGTFNSELSAAPKGDLVVWMANQQGRRNLWTADLSTGEAHALTNYTEDDGQDIGDIAWTPDGASLVYVRGGDFEFPGQPDPNPSLISSGVEQALYLAPVTGGTPRRLAPGRSPAVSPDGKTVAFLCKEGICALPLADPTAKPTALFHARGTLGPPLWSPDGARLAFTSGRGDHGFIGVYSLADKTITYLAPSTLTDRDPEWSPDSRQLAFLRTAPTPGPGAHRTGEPWSILIADAATGEGHEIFHAAKGQGSVFHSLATDRQLFWTSANRLIFPYELDGWQHLYAIPTEGAAAGSSATLPTSPANHTNLSFRSEAKESASPSPTPVISTGGPKGRSGETRFSTHTSTLTHTPELASQNVTLLTPGDFEVEHVSLSPDRSTLVFSSNQLDIDRRHLWQLSANSTTPHQLTKGEGIEVFPVLTASNQIATLRSDARTPIRPALVAPNGDLRDLAPQLVPADYPGKSFVTPQQVILPAADGLPLHAQLFLPAFASDGHRHPALVFFHGGSRRQMLLGYHYMDYYSNAYAMNQYLASLGYIVLSVNYRSGIGYGLNFREALNYGATGASEYNDVQGAGLYLRSRPDVDPSRIGAWGGSYGGYLTALALARASDMFSAGVDFHGVHDWSLRLGSQGASDPAASRLAFESSPMASVKTWRSPVLLIQGDDDRNVAFSQTVKMAAALRTQGVEFEEHVFPDEIHGFLMHRSWLEAYRLTADFFSRHYRMPAPQP